MSGSIPGGAQGSGAIGGFGDVIGGIGSFMQGNEAKDMGDYNATVYEQQAQAEHQNQILLEAQKKRIIKSQLGTQTAMVGKAGIKMSGSPLEVALDSMTNANLDLAIDKYNSDVKASNYQSQAAQTRYEAANAKKSDYLKGGLSVLSGAVKLASVIG